MSPPRPWPASIWARTHSERHLVLPQPLPASMSQMRQLPAGGSCSGLAQNSQVYANADRASSERLPRDRSSFDFCSGVSNANGDISRLPTTLGTHVRTVMKGSSCLRISARRSATGCNATGDALRQRWITVAKHLRVWRGQAVTHRAALNHGRQSLSRLPFKLAVSWYLNAR
jgi:hypothetical protein